MTRGKSWTPPEDEILTTARAQVPPVMYKEIAKRIGRSANGCEQRYCFLIHQKPGYVATVKRVAIAEIVGLPKRDGKVKRDYSAVLPCLTCGSDFKTPDRRKIRVCERCKNSDVWKACDVFHRAAGTATPARLAF